MDTFGDGWNAASFYSYDSKQRFRQVSSDCEENVIINEYCFDPNTAEDGDWVSATVFGYKATEPWEIIWQATISFGEDIVFYTGTYASVMTFEFHHKDEFHKHPHIILKCSKNLIPNDLEWYYFVITICIIMLFYNFFIILSIVHHV